MNVFNTESANGKGGQAMARQGKSVGMGRGHKRRIIVRGVRREAPDLRKLSRALIQLALAQAAAEVAAEAQAGEAAAKNGKPERPRE